MYFLYLSFWSLLSPFWNRVWNRLRFIFLPVNTQFLQQHVVEILFFLHWITSTPLQNQSRILVWVYLWVLYSVLLIYMSIFVPVPYYFHYFSILVQFEIKECDVSSFVLLSQNCFAYFFFVLWFHTNFRLFLWKLPLEFQLRLQQIYRLFWVVWTF